MRDAKGHFFLALVRFELEQESVRPRWPYDMRPSVRAEKYTHDANGAEKTLPMATTTGRTDRRTDRVRRNMRPPPREEGRIITEFGAVTQVTQK